MLHAPDVSSRSPPGFSGPSEASYTTTSTVCPIRTARVQPAQTISHSHSPRCRSSVVCRAVHRRRSGAAQWKHRPLPCRRWYHDRCTSWVRGAGGAKQLCESLRASSAMPTARAAPYRRLRSESGFRCTACAQDERRLGFGRFRAASKRLDPHDLWGRQRAPPEIARRRNIPKNGCF